MFPTVQVKLLEADALKRISVVAPLQIEAVVVVVTAGKGFTVTMIVKGLPIQDPAREVGVTI